MLVWTTKIPCSVQVPVLIVWVLLGITLLVGIVNVLVIWRGAGIVERHVPGSTAKKMDMGVQVLAQDI